MHHRNSFNLTINKKIQ